MGRHSRYAQSGRRARPRSLCLVIRHLKSDIYHFADLTSTALEPILLTSDI